MYRFLLLFILLFSVNAEEPEVLSGHSYHGEAFNEGPRQAAYLMGGTGNVDFEISSKSAKAKQFFLQGLGQLHGFGILKQSVHLDKLLYMIQNVP